MKRLTAFLLAAALVLSLTACGRGENASGDAAMTADEMLEAAEEIDLSEIMVQANANSVKAAELYLGNIYQVTGIIDSISSDSDRGNYCTLESTDQYYQFGGDGWVGGFFEVFLPDADFMDITTGQTITVVGEIARTDGIVEMKPAYLVAE